jgi:glycine cleavage system H protein
MQNNQEVSPQSVAEDKVAVIPCAGMDKALGSVARACAFEVVEKLRPGKAVLVCIPPLVAGVKSYSEIVKRYPSIPIDGCAERCATKIAVKNGARIKGRILIPECAQKHNLKPKSASDIGSDGEKLVEKLAGEIATEIDKLLGK